MVDKAYVKMWTLRKETQNHTHTHKQTGNAVTHTKINLLP